MLNLSADLNNHRAQPVIGPAHGHTSFFFFFFEPRILGDHSTSNNCTVQPPGLREIRGHGSLRKQCEELMHPLSSTTCGCPLLEHLSRTGRGWGVDVICCYEY
ncbi:hypothetical protein CKAH01_11655 [Colletotrichum kahawae]|uniref:Uncharacterized protein n=1 Tax=Colletotrichum kahawae TaxID=34407 RepID=A0AAD9YSZ4_COLKA|nr:hypothetical protein CKAH01_11655 [Colletotrichum kahawae]